MLQDDSSGGNHGLLSDLIHYVYQTTSNGLLLVGDDAQLPPVGQSNSPGLNIDLVKKRYDLDVISAELIDVMCQEQDSGILKNATQLRNGLGIDPPEIGFNTKEYKYIFRMTTEKMEDGLRSF